MTGSHSFSRRYLCISIRLETDLQNERMSQWRNTRSGCASGYSYTRLLPACTSSPGRVITELVTVMKSGIYTALWRDQQCINMTGPIVMVMPRSDHYACLLARVVCAGARARSGYLRVGDHTPRVYVVFLSSCLSSPCLLLLSRVSLFLLVCVWWWGLAYTVIISVCYTGLI